MKTYRCKSFALAIHKGVNFCKSFKEVEIYGNFGV